MPSTPVPLDTTEAIAPRPAERAGLRVPIEHAEDAARGRTRRAPEVDRRDEPLVFDLSGITLDLDPPATPPSQAIQTTAATSPLAEDEGSGDPVSRKMELAEEFQRIGDKDGARDLLREVLATATGSTKSKAQSMLEDLG